MYIIFPVGILGEIVGLTQLNIIAQQCSVACKLAFVAMAAASAVYKGFLEKRQRGLEHPNTDRLTFQRRYLSSPTKALNTMERERYCVGSNVWKVCNHDFKQARGPTIKPKKMFPIDRIRIIEVVDEYVFGKYFCFQVNDSSNPELLRSVHGLLSYIDICS